MRSSITSGKIGVVKIGNLKFEKSILSLFPYCQHHNERLQNWDEQFYLSQLKKNFSWWTKFCKLNEGSLIQHILSFWIKDIMRKVKKVLQPFSSNFACNTGNVFSAFQCVHFGTDLFDSKCQSDLMILIAIKCDEFGSRWSSVG